MYFAVLLTPFYVEAGILSSILGNEASADVGARTIDTSTDENANSQNMGLLQANVSSAFVTPDPKGSRQGGTSGTGKTDNKVALLDDTNIQIVSENAMLPSTGPLATSDNKEDIADASTLETSVYVVRQGDSLSAIAEMFGVSVNTILWANDMKKGDKLSEGDVLFILPISGLEHTVAKGQTLKNIAKLYKADVNDIAFYNGITPDDKLSAGDKLMIPGGEMFDEGGDKPAQNLNSAPARDRNYYATNPIQNLIGYFVNPVPAGHKTQGLHGPGHRGIDIGAPTGTEIYASASGKVLVVKTGCKVGQKRCGGGYGNMAIVEHANGTKTLYAHMSRLNTKSGADVARGQIIGYVGNTGRSTGPHIHFEVFNAKNPGTDWSWAK